MIFKNLMFHYIKNNKLIYYLKIMERDVDGMDDGV